MIFKLIDQKIFPSGATLSIRMKIFYKNPNLGNTFSPIHPHKPNSLYSIPGGGIFYQGGILIDSWQTLIISKKYPCFAILIIFLYLLTGSFFFVINSIPSRNLNDRIEYFRNHKEIDSLPQTSAFLSLYLCSPMIIGFSHHTIDEYSCQFK